MMADHRQPAERLRLGFEIAGGRAVAPTSLKGHFSRFHPPRQFLTPTCV